ncbi:hypothetical protein RMCBS344292_05473 [Rhizopus microsporus]|nr:hypothetical protein RMCBS344292_05473 [Rhizopus microsporus]
MSLYPSLTSISLKSKGLYKKPTAKELFDEIATMEDNLAQRKQKLVEVGASLHVKGQPNGSARNRNSGLSEEAHDALDTGHMYEEDLESGSAHSSEIRPIHEEQDDRFRLSPSYHSNRELSEFHSDDEISMEMELS